MVGIIDYGVGNLFSLRSSLAAIGQEAVVSADPEILRNADHILLPGVGAFEDAVGRLRDCHMDEMVYEAVKAGKPLMGICLGMQMLFEKSYEYGEHRGLGLLQGEVIPMAQRIPGDLKIPHMGWNALDIVKADSRLFARTQSGEYVYFVHSYFADRCEDSLAARTEYGAWLTAAVEKDNVFGCQFHPEKSGEVGLDILRAFCAV